MNKLLIFMLMFFTNSLIAQDVFLHMEEHNYPDRDSVFSIFKFKQKADSLNSKYKVKGMSRVNVEFQNNRFLLFEYSESGHLIQFLEMFEDSIYQSLKFTKSDSSFSFHKYNGFYANSHYTEFHYPLDNRVEYWYYDLTHFDRLERVLEISTGKKEMIEKEIIYENYEGTVTQRHFIMKNNRWLLQKETRYKE
ncbi:hypothetical protein [Salibacter halophilus]|uniref:Uncharacterized protein n=1 Tax=Salibacter halophilus TaxID=1803916 RepID=A0A6N6M773_9FLAO|nr:hypothetical protein [Salibacter halophilus]KAB1065908.1 hypothetical protein F3059_00095 [Salibacter halophilus]